MSKPRPLATALLLIAILVPTSLTAIEIDDLGVTHLLGVDDSVSIGLTMHIESGSGTRTRGVEVYLKSDGRTRRVFAQIVDPPFLNRTRFLSVERGGNRSARYLATSQGVRRLAASNSDERIFGSDFTAGDLSFFDMDEHDVDETAFDDPAFQAFQLRPIHGDGPVRTLSIDRETGLVMNVTYSEGSRVTKRYTVEAVGFSNGRPYPRVATMTTVADGSQTRISIERFDTETPIPDRFFHRAALE